MEYCNILITVSTLCHIKQNFPSPYFLPLFTLDETSCAKKKGFFIILAMILLADVIYTVLKYFELYWSEINDAFKKYLGVGEFMTHMTSFDPPLLVSYDIK